MGSSGLSLPFVMTPEDALLYAWKITKDNARATERAAAKDTARCRR